MQSSSDWTQSCLNGAAPEGAERRSDGTADGGQLMAGLNGAAPEGAERRAGRGVSLTLTGTPQWSRSRRSGATLLATREALVADLASMEPLPKERSDAQVA